MTSLLSFAESAVTVENTLIFPNLFGGTEIKYYRGFEVFGVPIYWYGVLIAAGILLAVAYIFPRLEKVYGLSKERAFDVIFIATVGGFIGARIYYCVFTTLNPDSGKDYNFITTFTEIRDGGIAIYGGLIAAFLIGLLVCRIRKVKYFAMCDAVAPGFLIGQAIGRWGNLINQEAYGADCPTDWLFAMKGSLIRPQGITGVVHPCFLYESIWCLVGFVFLHFYTKLLRSYDGEVFLLYVAWYGLERFFVEGLRTDSLMAGNARVSQVVAIVSCVAALILYALFKIYTKRKNIPLYAATEESKNLLAEEHRKEEEYKAKKAEKKRAKADRVLGEKIVRDEGENTAENTPENAPENAPENVPENATENAPENTAEDENDKQ